MDLAVRSVSRGQCYHEGCFGRYFRNQITHNAYLKDLRIKHILGRGTRQALIPRVIASTTPKRNIFLTTGRFVSFMVWLFLTLRFRYRVSFQTYCYALYRDICMPITEIEMHMRAIVKMTIQAHFWFYLV